MRPDSTSLAVEDVGVSSYDLAGRPCVLVRGGWTFRRALDGHCLQKQEGAPRLRRVLEPDEASPVIAGAREDVAAAVDALEDGVARGTPARDDARRRLRAVLEMDEAALSADADRFRALYRPIGILPPDQYLAVILPGHGGVCLEPVHLL